MKAHAWNPRTGRIWPTGRNSCHSKSLLYLVVLGAGLGFGDLRPHTQGPAMGRGPSQLMVRFLRLRNPAIALSFVISLDPELSKMACDSQHLYLCRAWQGLSFSERQYSTRYSTRWVKG